MPGFEDFLLVADSRKDRDKIMGTVCVLCTVCVTDRHKDLFSPSHGEKREGSEGGWGLVAGVWRQRV